MRYVKRSCVLVLSLLTGLLAVSLLLALSPQRVSEAARSSPAYSACDIQAITVTAALGREPGVADSSPYAGVSRLVYYAPAISTGTITLTVQLSIPQGVSCYLYGGKAFSRPVTWTTTLSHTLPSAELAYTVTAPFVSTPVRLDAIDAISGAPGTVSFAHPMAVLTFTPDFTPPEILTPSVSAADPRLHGAGPTLYYTVTNLSAPFFIEGHSLDTEAGLSHTAFSKSEVLERAGAWCGTPYPADTSTQSAWSARYCLPAVFSSTGVITATSYDLVGNRRPMTFTFQPDGTPPTSVITPPVSVLIGSSVTVPWQADDVGSGVAALSVLYRPVSAAGWMSATLAMSDSPTGVLVFTPALGALAQPVTYELLSQASDQVGNREVIAGKAVKYVKVFPRTVYLPLALKGYWPCTPLDQEPNDTFDAAQALPLIGTSPMTGTASGNFCAGDVADYYVITTTGQFLSVKLSVPAGVNLDLYGYDAARNPAFVAAATAGDEWVVRELPAGPYYVEVRRIGQPGPLDASSYTLKVKDIPQPVANGGFDKSPSSLPDWLAGGGLGSSVASGIGGANGQVALLGNEEYACRGVPVDYSSLSQSLELFQPQADQSILLKFRYRIYTNDRNRDMVDNYDSFDLFVNNIRVFRDANRTLFDGCNVSPYDLGWKDGEYKFGPGAIGQPVSIDFQVHNRGDNYYNTYVYLDDVRIVVSSQ